MPTRTVHRADAEFEVKQDGVMLGTLKISKGSLVWSSGTTCGCKMAWGKFDRIMKEHATREEKR